MKLLVRFERFLSPGLSTCWRCHRPWRVSAQRRLGPRSFQQLDRERYFGLIGVKSHTTRYSDSSGCFPLCEGCWQALSPAERLPFYRQLVDDWNQWGDREGSWTAIEAAVLEGK